MVGAFRWFAKCCLLMALALIVVGAFSQCAEAGSNTWTTWGSYGCASSYANFGDGMACEVAGYFDDNPGFVLCSGPSYQQLSDDPGPPHSISARYTFTRDITVPFDCGNPVTLNSGSKSFTETCSSLELEYESGVGCVEPFDCGVYEGSSFQHYWDGDMSDAPSCMELLSVPGESCAVQTRSVAACIAGGCASQVQYTGASCAGSQDSEQATATDGAANCISSDGLTLCAQSSEENCGLVNGAEVCLDSVPSGECVFLGNGGMVCASDVSGPPGPTEGDGTTPATPDGTFELGEAGSSSGSELDYYDAGTVAGSGSAVEGTLEEGLPEGEGECVPEWLCDEPGVPELETLDGEATTFGAFMGRVENSDLVSGIDSAIGTMPEGVCPAPSLMVDYLSTTITLDAHCSLWTSIAAVLEAVMLAVWLFAGIRIVMSA
jgi:hypothetical protein